MDKKKTKIEDFEKDLVKKQVSTISKIYQKIQSKYNGYRSAINITQNFKHDQNKNFNLCTRHI